MAAVAALVRLYRPSRWRPRCAHFVPAAIASGGLTLCGESTRGMRGRLPAEHQVALTLPVCAGCQAEADRHRIGG